jgi:hypothetical protein
MFVSRKEFEQLKEHVQGLTEIVLRQEEEIRELKKPKEPNYMA